jgi:hypothetical protein
MNSFMVYAVVGASLSPAGLASPTACAKAIAVAQAAKAQQACSIEGYKLKLLPVDHA